VLEFDWRVLDLLEYLDCPLPAFELGSSRSVQVGGSELRESGKFSVLS